VHRKFTNQQNAFSHIPSVRVFKPTVLLGRKCLSNFGHNTWWKHSSVPFAKYLVYPPGESPVCNVTVDSEKKDSK